MLERLNSAFQKLGEKLGGWLDALIINLPNILLALLVMTLAIVASRFLKKGLRKVVGRFAKDRSVTNLIASAGSILVILVALFISLGILNLNQALTSLLTTAGIAGLAVGMAVQDPLMNTMSGVVMSMRNYYNIGDWVQTNGYEGKIEKIRLRWTELHRPSGEVIFLPNRKVVSEALENFSIAGRRRIEVYCGIAYDSDLDEVKQVAVDAVNTEFDAIQMEGVPEFYYTEFGDSSINFVLRFWVCTKSLIEYKAAKSEAIIRLKKTFDKHGIEIPFPIRTLVMAEEKALV